MRCVGMMRAACVGAALLACAAGIARADPALGDLSDGPASPDALRGGTGVETFLYYSGFDLWRGGGSFYGGLQWAPGGLNSDGFTLKVLLAEGTYRYLSGADSFRGTGLRLRSLPDGASCRRCGISCSPASTSRTTALAGHPASSLRGSRRGQRVNAESWWSRAR